jgi:hypothetical protein
MKKYIFLSVTSILMMLSTQKANAQEDFSAVNDDGKTIYYYISSSTPPLTAEVTYGMLNDKPILYTDTIAIPDNVANGEDTYTVTSIGMNAFADCKGLTAVDIPATVTTIRTSAFNTCEGLTSLTIPDGVITIGGSAFFNCKNLTSVSIGNSVTTIGENAFNGCTKLASELAIPNSVITVGKSAFYSCIGLTSLVIGNAVETIGERAFGNCSKLTFAVIPASVTFIGRGIFYDCRSMTAIDVDAANANYCSVEGVLFNKAQTSVLQYPAGKAGAYTIPSSVTIIESDAFFDCAELTSVVIPNGAMTIGSLAFADCTGLTEMYIRTINPPQIVDNTFDGIRQNIPVYVCNSVDIYKAAEHWNYFTNIIENCTGVKDIYMEHGITLYPNPTEDNISFTLPENVSQAVFTLYDMQGRTIIRQNISNQDVLQVDNLASGMYVYYVRTEKQNYQGKLIRK